jgi:type IV pilus assembly protein PilV
MTVINAATTHHACAHHARAHHSHARANSRCENSTVHAVKVVRGMTLIEVLVSLLVISVGVLGMIALQANSMRFLQSSHSQGTAAMLANDVADRMRANGLETNNNNGYNHAFNGVHESTTVADCTAQPCTSAQLANYDLDQWQHLLTASLPSASSAIARTTTAGTGGATTHNFLVTIRWDDDRSGSTGTECDPAQKTSADLDCWQITVSL